MIFSSLFLLVLALIILIKSAGLAVEYSTRIARAFSLSEFMVSFFVVAFISVLPEATISVVSAFRGVPTFGIGTLLGSNVADLSLVFGIIAILSPKGISVRSAIIRRDFLYLGILALPILLGLDGGYSRIDGVILVIMGIYFYYTVFISRRVFHSTAKRIPARTVFTSTILLLFSLVFLITSANYTVVFGIQIAEELNIPSIFIALIFIAASTCLPELIFSIQAVRKNHNDLAMGDILGTVLTDATILIGITAIITPVILPRTLIIVTGVFMLLAGFLSMFFIQSGHKLTRTEGWYLIVFYLLFLFSEFLIS